MVGTRVRHRCAPLGQHPLITAAAQQFANVLGTLVLQHKDAARQRLKLADAGVGLKALFLPRSNFAGGGNPDHIAMLLHCQPIDLQQRIKSATPGHLVQAQADPAANFIAGDNIQAGEFGKCLKRRRQIHLA